MIDEDLLIETLKDIKSRVNPDGLGEYKILSLAPLLSRLLLGNNSVVASLAKKYDHKIRYTIGDWGPPIFRGQEPTFWSVQDGLDPDTSMNPLRAITIDQRGLLEHMVIIADGQHITIGDILSYLIVVGGAAQTSVPTNAKELILHNIAETISVGGYDPSVRTLQAVGRVVLKALEPLRKKVVQSINQSRPKASHSRVTRLPRSSRTASLRDFQQQKRMSILRLLKEEEDAHLEFKVGVYSNPYTGLEDKQMIKEVVIAVASFLNSTGGTVLVGVDDDGKIVTAPDGRVVGVQPEYIVGGRAANRDGYIRWLEDKIKDGLSVGAPCLSSVHITITRVQEVDVCRIDVEPYHKEVYVKGDDGSKFYIRSSKRSQLLDTSEAVEYIRKRWPVSDVSNTQLDSSTSLLSSSHKAKSMILYISERN